MAIYRNQCKDFIIEVKSQWIENTVEKYGNICFRSYDGAVVSFSSCTASSSGISDPDDRREWIYKELSIEMPGARQNWDAFRPIPGSFNIASGQVIGSNGVLGLISILHLGIEYTISYTIPITSPYSAIKKVNDIVLSFRLRTQPGTELFIDPQKLLKERKRWWHFWRLLGQ